MVLVSEVLVLMMTTGYSDSNRLPMLHLFFFSAGIPSHCPRKSVTAGERGAIPHTCLPRLIFVGVGGGHQPAHHLLCSHRSTQKGPALVG